LNNKTLPEKISRIEGYENIDAATARKLPVCEISRPDTIVCVVAG